MGSWFSLPVLPPVEETRDPVPVTALVALTPEPVAFAPNVTAGSSSSVWTVSALPMVAAGSENMTSSVWQHRVPSAADSQQYAAGSSYPWLPPHSHTCTPPVPKSYADAFAASQPGGCQRGVGEDPYD